MIPPNRVEVSISKRKVALLALGGIAFVALGIWLFAEANAQTRRPPLYVKSGAIVTILFFGMCTVLALRKLFDRTPGLLLDGKGITDRLTRNFRGASDGQVMWADIKDVEARKVHGQRYLVLIMKNPTEYVERGNVVARFFRRLDAKLYGSPLYISTGALKMDFENLASMVRAFHQRGSDA